MMERQPQCRPQCRQKQWQWKKGTGDGGEWHEGVTVCGHQ